MTESRNLRWISVVAALALAFAPASAADWRRQTVSQDGFSVEFSGDVKEIQTPLKPDTQDAVIRSTIYMQGNDTYAFIVGATLLKAGFDFPAGVDGTIARYKCTQLDSDVPGTLGDGTLTRVVHSHHCADGLQIGGSFFLRGQWFYQVLTIIGADVDPGDAEHFLNSFRLLPNR